MIDISIQRPFTTVVIDSTLNCNLSCSYCHESNNMLMNREHSFVSISLIEGLFEEMKILQGKGLLKYPYFCWYGGEPLLLGIDKFKEIFKLQKEVFGQNVYNQINTNGILINDDWVKLFVKWNVELILSIDGPRNLNINRKGRNGEDKFDEIMKGIDIIRNSPIPLKYINVINEVNVDFPELIYEFTKSLGASSVDYAACYSDQIDSVDPIKYLNFLCKIYDLWSTDLDKGKPKRITSLSSIIDGIVNGETSCCTYSENCGRRLYMTTNGDVKYCCSGWYGDPLYNFGNIRNKGVEEMLNDTVRINRIKNEFSPHLEACKECDVFELCGGGCRFQFPSSMGNPTFYCQTRLNLIHYIQEDLKFKGIKILDLSSSAYKEKH